MAHVISEDCIACGSCMSTCQHDAISEGDIFVINPKACVDCGDCEDGCPVEAISQM